LVLTLVSFAVLIIPVTAVWLPRFVLFNEAGLLDSRLAPTSIASLLRRVRASSSTQCR
jgi:hypothetical protein